MDIFWHSWHPSGQEKPYQKKGTGLPNNWEPYFILAFTHLALPKRVTSKLWRQNTYSNDLTYFDIPTQLLSQKIKCQVRGYPWSFIGYPGHAFFVLVFLLVPVGFPVPFLQRVWSSPPLFSSGTPDSTLDLERIKKRKWNKCSYSGQPVVVVGMGSAPAEHGKQLLLRMHFTVKLQSL